MKKFTTFFPKNVKIPDTRLTPIAITEDKSGNWTYLCKCDCGKETLALHANIIGKRVKSCGCLKSEQAAQRERTHGLSNTPEYYAAKTAWDRCYNKKNARYADYGGRGIICIFKNVDEFVVWLHSEMPRPRKGMVLDRIVNDGHYSKTNLKWSTPLESVCNRRNTYKITINGITKSATEWSQQSGVHRQTIITRHKRGYPESMLLHKGELSTSVRAKIAYGQL